MKKYTPRTTIFLTVLIFISIAMLLTGIVLIVAEYQNDSAGIGLSAFGGLMGILFFACFLTEKSRALIIDENTITFPRGVQKNGKTVLQKTVINIKEIRSVESKFYKGDGLISGDCYFHTLKLKDGTKITVTLFAYGKEAEKEILKFINNSIY